MSINEFEIEFGSKANEFEIDLENVVQEVQPTLEDIELTPTTEEQKFKSKTHYGYNEVTVKPVTADIDSNIIPENIKKGTSILGVEGECKGEVENTVSYIK